MRNVIHVNNNVPWPMRHATFTQDKFIYRTIFNLSIDIAQRTPINFIAIDMCIISLRVHHSAISSILITISFR